jgi:hypothetical protein
VSRVANPIGTDWIKVGESAVTLDPLSSQGVAAAIAQGLQAAAVVNTILRHSDYAEPARILYRDRIRETIEQNAAAAAEFYQRQSLVCANPFWQRRAVSAAPVGKSGPAVSTPDLSATAPLRISSELQIVPTPVLLDNVIGLELAAVHPRLTHPVAWLGGYRLASLLEDIDGHTSASNLLDRWEGTMPSNVATQILRWVWQCGLVTVASENSVAKSSN